MLAEPSLFSLTAAGWSAYRLRGIEQVRKGEKLPCIQSFISLALNSQAQGNTLDDSAPLTPVTCFPPTLEQGEENIVGNGHARMALPAARCSSLHSHGPHVVVPTPTPLSYFFVFPKRVDLGDPSHLHHS